MKALFMLRFRLRQMIDRIRYWFVMESTQRHVRVIIKLSSPISAVSRVIAYARQETDYDLSDKDSVQ